MRCRGVGKQCLQNSRSWFRDNIIMVATMAAVVLGLALGFSIRLANPSPEVITWISIWGELFLRMLKMIILPLTVCCLVVGVASMDSAASGKLGLITLGYVFTTHVIAVILGIILVVSIKPGAGFNDVPPDSVTQQAVSYTDVFTDLLRNLVPENIIQACIQTAYTSVTVNTSPLSHGEPLSINITDPEGIQATYLYNTSGLVDDDQTATMDAVRQLVYRDKMNIIGIVILSLVFGVSISVAGKAGKPIYALMVSLHDVIFVIMKVIMWYSPLGIMSLIAGAILKIEDLSNAIQSVGLLVATATVGCLIHQMIVLPIIMVIVCRRNPFAFMLKISDAIMAGIAPPSSVASMPPFLSGLPTKLGLSKRVVQFVIPIEVTINRDGSLLYVVVVSIFCAQTYGIPLNAGQIIVLGIFSTVMVIAVASVPSSSIMIVILLCSAFNIPTDERIGLFMAVDWLLDRVRTSANVVSHGFGCAIIDKLAKRFLNIDGQCADTNSISKDPNWCLDDTSRATGGDQSENDPLTNTV